MFPRSALIAVNWPGSLAISSLQREGSPPAADGGKVFGLMLLDPPSASFNSDPFWHYEALTLVARQGAGFVVASDGAAAREGPRCLGSPAHPPKHSSALGRACRLPSTLFPSCSVVFLQPRQLLFVRYFKV